MKFEYKIVDFKGQDWIQNQNKALEQLSQRQKEDPNFKFGQKEILDVAANLAMDQILQKQWQELLQQNEGVYLKPIATILTNNPDQLQINAKYYYFDALEQINFDFKPAEPIKPRPNFEDDIKRFTAEFIQKYRFRFKREDKIQSGDEVSVLVQDTNNKENQHTYRILASSEKETEELNSFVVGKKIGDEFSLEKYGPSLVGKIVDAYYFVEDQITDQNAHLILGKNFKNLEDVKADIYKTTKEQVMNDAVFNYGNAILNQIMEINKDLIDIPEELIKADLDSFSQPPVGTNLSKEQLVFLAIFEFLWHTIIKKHFNFDISNEEFQKEMQFVLSFMNEEEQKNIQIPLVLNAILVKKLGLVYLSKYDPEFYKNNKNYFIISI